jgi:clan AA aspartic protease (TIGR02281 family)
LNIGISDIWDFSVQYNRFITIIISSLLAGIAGYGIAYYQFHPRIAVENGRVPEPAHVFSAIDTASEQGSVVVVQFYDGNDKPVRQANGVLVNAPGSSKPLLLTPAAGFHEVERADVVAAGQRHALEKIVALDADTGLVLIATELSNVQGLTPAADTSLYLGREVQVVTPHANVPGIVNSPAQRYAGNHYSYEIDHNAPLASGFTALQDPAANKLIGVIVKRNQKTGQSLAVDSGVINSLIDHIGGTPAQSVAQFSHSYFLDTVQGRLHQIAVAATQADWLTVVELGKKLSYDNLVGHDDIASQLDYAFLYVANSELETGRYHSALSILDDADRLLDASAGRSRIRAKILFNTGQALEGIAELIRSIDQGIADEASYAMLQSLVLNEVDSGKHADSSINELLNQAIAHDADFAPYHTKLGKLLYRQSRYAEALSSFNYALQLDPALLNELNPLMNTARQRLNLPGQIVVPLHVQGNSIGVDVNVNRVPKRLILDTGASVSVLSTGVADELGLKTYSTEFVMLNTANGVVRAPLIMLDSISLANATVSNIKVAILNDLGPIDGLLGLDFLNHFDIDINQASGEMMLRRR